MSMHPVQKVEKIRFCHRNRLLHRRFPCVCVHKDGQFPKRYEGHYGKREANVINEKPRKKANLCFYGVTRVGGQFLLLQGFELKMLIKNLSATALLG